MIDREAWHAEVHGGNKESDTTEQLSTQTRKEIKLSLLADDMILYMDDPKDTPGKLLEFIN